jgi:hypothetical protein
MEGTMDKTVGFEWQETVDMAVAALEKRTGLKLAGLSQPEITHRVRQWLKTKQEEKINTTDDQKTPADKSSVL